eukprot:g16162.t2
MEERVHRRHANPVDFFMDLVTPDASNSQVDLFVEQYRDRLEPRVLREVERGLELEMPSALDLLENVRAQMLESLAAHAAFTAHGPRVAGLAGLVAGGAARLPREVKKKVGSQVIDMARLEERFREMQGMRARDLREELEGLGISTAGCVDRHRGDALVDFLIFGKETFSENPSNSHVQNPNPMGLGFVDMLGIVIERDVLEVQNHQLGESLVEVLEKEGRKMLLEAGSASSSSTALSPSKKVLSRMEELRALRARDLRRELNELGLNTEGRVDRESLLELLEAPEAIEAMERASDGHSEGVTEEPKKEKARVITLDLEVGCSPLRFVVDTACYHSIMKENLVENLFQACFSGQPDWAKEEAPGSGIRQATISNAWLADGKISCGDVLIATIPDDELPVPGGCAGILGLDFLTLFDWDFDIDAKKAQIATAPKERKAPLPFDVSLMIPVPLLKIRTPSGNELYACQVKLATPGQDLEEVKFIQGFPDLASAHTLCNKDAAKGMKKPKVKNKGFGASGSVPEKKRKFVDVRTEELPAVFGIGNSAEGCCVRENPVLAGDVEAFQVLRLTEWPSVILGADLLVRERLVLSFRRNRMYLPSFKWGDMPPVRNSVYGVRFRRQLWYVFLRQVRLRWRDRNGLVADLLGAAVKALVVGIVYMRTGELAAQQQVSFFFMLCMTTAIDGLKNMPMVIGERTIVKMETSEVLYSDWAYIISFTVLNLCQALVVHSIFIAILFAMSGLRWTMFPSAYLWSTLLSASWSVDQRVIQAVSESPIGDSRRWNGRPGGALAISAQKGREGLDVFQELLGAPKSSPAFRLEAGGR